MPVNPVSVLVISCSNTKLASLLAKEWENLPNWHGFSPVRKPAELHNNRIILCLTCDSSLRAENPPEWVETICAWPNSADLSAVKHRLWPKQHNNDRKEVKLVKLFERGKP